MAPPGYAAYTATPMGSVPLKRVGGVARAASILCLVSAALSVIELLVRSASRDEARDFRDGELSDSEFVEAVAGYALIGFVIGIVTVAAAVVTIIWMYRVASNHRSLHRDTTWGPGWAIGGWFTPPFLYVVPTLMLREMWQASDPDVPVGGDWKSRPGTLLPFVWLVLYGVIPLALLVVEIGSTFGSLTNSEEQLADQILGNQTLSIVGAIVSVAAAVVFVRLVRGLTRRHRLLTGEAAAR
jgi:hypothetical protein